jgi:hypothetical protein
MTHRLTIALWFSFGAGTPPTQKLYRFFAAVGHQTLGAAEDWDFAIERRTSTQVVYCYGKVLAVL